MAGKRRSFIDEVKEQRYQKTREDLAPTPDEVQAQERAVEEAAKPVRKSRRWDRENPAFSYRVLPEDNDRMVELAEAWGWSRDEVARGLVGAALEAVDAGMLELHIERESEVKTVPVTTSTGKKTTRRISSISSTITWTWHGAANPAVKSKPQR